MSKENISTTMHTSEHSSTPVVPHREALLGRQQKRVLALLSKGGMYSVVDITNRLGVSDPRGHIRDLRAKGYPIGDTWVTTHYGNRFKKYFVINK